MSHRPHSRPSSFHEPLLPFVWLPVQDGLGLTHTFFRGRLCKRCRFSNTFWPLQLFLLLASSRKNPYPCLIPASPLPLAPPTHTHMHFGTLWPSLPETTENEKSSERENLVFPGQESFGVFFPPLYSGLLVGVESFVESLFLPPFPLSSRSHPSRFGGFTCFSSTSRALWGLDCSRPGALEQFPSGFLSPLDAKPAVSQATAPTVLRVPRASD